MARLIQLTRGFEAIVDDADYEQVARFTWHTDIREHNCYARAPIGPKLVRMHRFLLQPASHMLVDHIDGNGLNNQRSNLRICNKAENGRNCVSRKGLSRFKGVARDGKRWAARITDGPKGLYLGSFDTEEAAARAYDAAAVHLYGQFAKTNF